MIVLLQESISTFTGKITCLTRLAPCPFTTTMVIIFDEIICTVYASPSLRNVQAGLAVRLAKVVEKAKRAKTCRFQEVGLG
jgi:hypothetical protein